MSDPDFATLPVQALAGQLQSYLDSGDPPASKFLMALLEMRRGDAVEEWLKEKGLGDVFVVEDWFTWLRRNMPQGSWGSPRIVELWCNAREDT